MGWACDLNWVGLWVVHVTEFPNGSMAQWLAQRLNGSMAHWLSLPSRYMTRPVLEDLAVYFWLNGSIGSMVSKVFCWLNGPTAQRLVGSLVQRLNGSTARCPHWLNGSVCQVNT